MIRKAKLTDVKAIQSLVNQYADAGQMLPRTLNEIYEHLRDFHVYEDNDSLVGVCALHVSWDGLAEIRSLAVHRDRVKHGIGAELVRKCLLEAAELQVERVFVLTYQAVFFNKLGFTEVDKKELPHKIWTDCLNCVKFPDCDETALIINITPKTDSSQ
jgi:amino-acid N-acetyltransferase